MGGKVGGSRQVSKTRYREPRSNVPLDNEVPGVTIDIAHSGQSYSKMCGTERRYNEPGGSEIPNTMNAVQTPTLKIS